MVSQIDPYIFFAKAMFLYSVPTIDGLRYFLVFTYLSTHMRMTKLTNGAIFAGNLRFSSENKT